VEVDLIARVSVGTLEVGCELMAQLHPRGEGPLRQFHESQLGHTDQGHQEIIGHDGLISSYGVDQGEVDLQELNGANTPIVLLQQVRSELARPNHHVEVRGKRHATTPRSCRGHGGVCSLPHRGSVHCIKVPIEVVTLAVAPLPLALDGDVAVLTRATTLKFGLQIRRSETCYMYCR
jgi:hypothetical protein